MRATIEVGLWAGIFMRTSDGVLVVNVCGGWCLFLVLCEVEQK